MSMNKAHIESLIRAKMVNWGYADTTEDAQFLAVELAEEWLKDRDEAHRLGYSDGYEEGFAAGQEQAS